MQRRVVITGIGMLTALGNEPQEFFTNALNGKCGIRRITKFDASAFPVQIGAELNLQDDDRLPPERAAEMPSVAQWAVIAARKSVADAHLNLQTEDPYSIDVILGTSLSSLEALRTEYMASSSGLAFASAVTPVLMSPASAAIQVSRDLGLHGETVNITTACSSAASAIGYATRLIQSGTRNCVITGGADEGVSKLFVGSFGNSKGVSHRNQDPQHACRPFDRSRDGFVVGDAACIFIIEEYERALKRGARVYCEISGYAGTSDASTAFKVAKSDEHGARAIQQALYNAKRTPDAIQYYCAVGVGDPWFDIRETRMIKRAFGESAKKLAISSIKSMVGHPMGASGALQTATAALAIKNAAIPPTLNCDEPDPECDLDYVPNYGRSMSVRNALVYTIGNTTNNALVLSAC